MLSHCGGRPPRETITGMAAGVVVGVVLIWLSSRRVEFGWRMLWLLVIVVAICAGSASNAVKVMGAIGDGLYEVAHGIAAMFSLL
jgi:hypothetical protein